MKHDVKSIEELLNNTNHQELMNYIDSLILELYPNIEKYLVLSNTLSMIGYIKKKDGFPLLALASQKNFVSIYVASYKDGENIINKYRNEFNKNAMKSSCLSFSSVTQINVEVLKKIIQEAVELYNVKKET